MQFLLIINIKKIKKTNKTNNFKISSWLLKATNRLYRSKNRNGESQERNEVEVMYINVQVGRREKKFP